MAERILDMENLHVSFDTYAGEVKAVRGVTLHVDEGEVLAIVGESGCGKSVTAQTIMKLNPMPPARIVEGKINLAGHDIVKASEKDMQKIRGQEVAMIFQDPMTCMNPTTQVGKQIVESIKLHRHLSRQEAKEEAIKCLKQVNIPNPEERAKQYPHEFSGGMRQRAMIAMALSCNPKLLIADEPTTALDVTIQAQIMDLLVELKDKINTAIILITHDLGVVAGIADRVAVMYAGKVVETGTTAQIFYEHKHLSRQEAKEEAVKCLKQVNIPNPEERAKQYPHEFSGGMRQRAMIAMALSCNPKLLIADEPTTALDVTIQAQIMDLLVELKDKINTAIILITHDLGVVAGIADRVAVMYAGKVVETGTTAQIFYEHKHPYTEALLRSLPSAEAGKREPLMSIPGTPPDLLCPPKGCGFAARCRHCMQICREEQPPEFELGDGHKASCWLLHPDCPCAAERGDDQ